MDDLDFIQPYKRIPVELELSSDCISRQGAIDVICKAECDSGFCGVECKEVLALRNIPSALPERLTDDDFETIRIHLNAFKEKLCNQHRWEEAEEYQRIIDRFMSFASTHRKENQ